MNDLPVVEPFALEVFLTNRCNVNGSDCSSRYTTRKKEAKTLTFDQLKQAVDVISPDRYIQDKFNGQVRISFTGGEPLLEFELLKKAISYIRTKEPDFKIVVKPNGTLPTENMMNFFVRNNVEIYLEVSGLRRKFRNNGKKSAFESIMSDLKNSRIIKRYADHFCIRTTFACVRTTFTSQTIDSLPEVVKFFKHDVGVKQLRIGLDTYEIWGQAGINRLRNVLRSLKSKFLATLKHGMDVKNMEFAFPEFLFSQSDGADYHELARKTIILFYDGYFYPSDFVVKPPLEKKYRVGDLKHGIDFKRLETMSSLPMVTNISRKCKYTSGLLPPLERYYWGVVHKFTPDKLNKVLKNTSQINKVFNEEMEWYVKLKRIYERLVKTPSFGDFAHSPKYRSDKEIKSSRLIIRNDSNIGELREDIDYFLYSPGKEKKLILDAMDNTQTALDVMEGLVLYVLMKAGYLKKRIKLMVACEAGDTSAFSARGGPSSGGGWDANRRRYLKEHGVSIGTRGSTLKNGSIQPRKLRARELSLP